MSTTPSAPAADPVRLPALPWAPGRPADEVLPPATELADEILERCRGEGPANCVGQCPLGVDARGYVQLAKEGRFDEALQKVREKLPFPGILGYICAHPCELQCKKIDEDSSIRVRDIKRFLAERETGEPRHIVDKAPARAKKVAVVGSGPSGLMAAHDLAMEGYQVTLLERESTIGGCLIHKIPDYRLPHEVARRDLTVIDALGIEVKTGVELGKDFYLDGLRESYDAVVLCLGYEGGLDVLEKTGDFGRSARDTLGVDPLTLETAIPKIFAAGDTTSGPSTVIQSLALGRQAATSVDRMLRGANLREGRTLPVPPRPLWTLEIDESERQSRERSPVMLTPYNDSMNEAEVLEESKRCLNCVCGLCVDDCEFLTKFCDTSPKEIARKIKAGIEIPETLQMTFSCNICSLCSRVCPEELDTGKMLLAARQEAQQKLGSRPQHKPIISYWKAGVAGMFSMVMPEPGRQKAKRLFFTGCALPAVMPGHAISIYNALRKHYPGTGVVMLCCGAPVELIGMEEEHHMNVEMLTRMAESVGAEELLPACPDCAHALTESMPEFKITPVWQLLADAWDPPRKREGVTVSIHDSCKAAHMPELHDAVRTLITKGGAEIDEVEYNREMGRCCGFGGMIYPIDAELSQKVTQRRADESEHPMVTYCAGCRMALKGCGKESIHLVDLLYEDDWKKKANAPPPGALGRYANRLMTKWRFKGLKPLTA